MRASSALTRRLAPLYLAVFLQNLALWVPIEKLFMTSIGFTSASVGVMAAVYAVVVPVLELPSGVLADRWSRRAVLLLASVALLVSVLIGGLSEDVTVYLVAAVFLGVFFALQSGTLESMVYDAVLEETGDSEAFERTIGRVRLIESIALVASALAGGLIAQFAPLRVTYFLTAVPLLLSAVLLMRFREPRLHKAEERQTLRAQIGATYRTILAGGQFRAIVALTVVAAVLMQGMLEFGPLWLVALSVPAFLYGPHWAGLTAALGIGSVLGARPGVTRDRSVRLLALAVVGCCLVLVVSEDAVVVIGVQIALTLLVVAVSIPVTRSLHDAVPSAIRAGVASGVGTLTWLAFVPFAVAFGVLSERAGLDRGAFLFVAMGVAGALLILVVLPRSRPTVELSSVAELAMRPDPAAGQPTFPADRFFPEDDPIWPGHWADPPLPWTGAGPALESPGALEEARAAIADLPARMRQVMVLRDIQGRSASDVRGELALSPEEEGDLLQEARARVRGRLESYLMGREADHE